LTLTSFATAKFIASIGFHEILLLAKLRIVLAKGMDVLKSYRTMFLSVAVEANIEVSTGEKATDVIVSVEVGHFRTSGGAVVRSRL
jgi:hypothetical protein